MAIWKSAFKFVTFQFHLCLPLTIGVELSELTFLALFFPQYYPVPENVKFSANGTKLGVLTEWDIVRKSPKRSIYGHPIVQPVSYYDLRDRRARQQHAEEARRIGVDAFIYYHYWMNNHAVMDTVLQLMLIDNEPRLPFALCWANERWDKFSGPYGERERAIEQRYDLPRNHAIWMVPFFRHPMYIRHLNRPVIYVYHLRRVPRGYWNRINEALQEFDIPPLYIVGHLMQYGDNNHRMLPQADFSAEFPPHVPGAMNRSERFDWDGLGFGSTLTRGLLVAWDPTPRYFNSSSRGKYSAMSFPHGPQHFFEYCKRRVCTRDDRNVLKQWIIFAWNEWGEGAVLEKSSTYPHYGYGDALKDCRSELLKCRSLTSK